MKLRTLSAAILLASAATSALADTPAVTFDSLNSVWSSSSVWNLGFEFQANTNTFATQLGSLTAGIGEGPVSVGLWDSLGNLLASTTVTYGSPTLNQFSYSSIAPVALTAGSDYYVGSVGYTAYGFGPNNFATAPQITYLQDAFNNNGVSLSVPTSSEGYTNGFGWYGANLQIGAIPEPSTYAMLLAGLGMIGFIAYRRKDTASGVTMAA